MYLIYDDEPDIVEIAMDYLYYAGIQVIGTTNKDTFMQCVRTKKDSLKGVLFDLSFMRESDLLELKAINIPTYCITGSFIPEGFDGLEKPFNSKDLIKLVG